MRYLKILVVLVLAVTLLLILSAVHSGPQAGKVPLRSGLFENCATVIAPQPKTWTVTNVNLEHTVRVTILADVCRNSLLGTSTTSGFHIIALPEHSGAPADLSPDELQQFLDQNTLVDLDTSSIGEIRPAIVMLNDLPKGIADFDIHDEGTTRRDFGIEFLCNQQCDPGKIRIRRRNVLGANFYYVVFNPDPIAL